MRKKCFAATCRLRRTAESVRIHRKYVRICNLFILNSNNTGFLESLERLLVTPPAFKACSLLHADPRQHIFLGSLRLVWTRAGEKIYNTLANTCRKHDKTWSQYISASAASALAIHFLNPKSYGFTGVEFYCKSPQYLLVTPR